MEEFFENPLVEGDLSFDFGQSSGATRYEVWDSYLHILQHPDRKAVDFIFAVPETSELFFTEVKDFKTITHEGKYLKGDCSLTLAVDTAKKMADSFDGYAMIGQVSKDADELAFISTTGNFGKVVVFHWEFNPIFPTQKRLHDMKTMKAKLRELLEGVCSNIRIESIEINPSKHWKVTRVGESVQ